MPCWRRANGRPGLEEPLAGAARTSRGGHQRPAPDLVVDTVRKGGCSAIFHAISEDDLGRIMRHLATRIASDASPGIPAFGKTYRIHAPTARSRSVWRHKDECPPAFPEHR